MRLSILMLGLVMLTGAAAVDRPRLRVQLEDSGKAAPHCGMMHFVVVMKYRVLQVIKGKFDDEFLYVAQSCPEFAFPGIVMPFLPGRIFEMSIGAFNGEGALMGSAPPGHKLNTVERVVAAGPLLAPSAPVPPSGLYERFSPLTLAPSGPLEAGQTARVNSWLDVTTAGSEMEIVFKPESRIRWRLIYGAHGLEHKTTTVDGEVWTESEFTYDDAGHLAHKKVIGAGAPVALEFDYKTSPVGAILERTGKLPSKSGKEPAADRVVVTDIGGEFRLEESIDGVSARNDFYDFGGRLRRTEFGKPASGSKHLVLRYERDSTGALEEVMAFQGSEYPRKADWSHPVKGVTPQQLSLLGPLVERSEALLFFGAPITHSVTGKGLARTVTDSYFKECKLNETTALSYDPSDLVISAVATCICGFCVEGNPEPVGAELGRDEHWSEGPWLRLNGEVNVTPDHQLMTTSGPRRASDLKVGDLILNSRNEPEPLRSVEKLKDDKQRLGVNLRTDSGVFVSGALRFVSEPLKGCEP